MMNVAKLRSLVQPIRLQYSFGRLVSTESRNVHDVLQTNGHTMSNKNLILYNYIKKSKSNDHFLLLPDTFNYWLKVPQDTIESIREAMDYVLQGILLFDDVQDGTEYRRNLPSANRVYGAPLAANASVFCFFAALEKISRLKSPEAVNAYCGQMMAALDGIALDVYWRDSFRCPTEEEYIEMVKKKVAFFRLCFEVVQTFSENRGDYSNLINTYGIYYQIRDEYTNLACVKSLDTKERENEFKDLHEVMFCEDITEGRFTFPIIHGLNSSEGPTIRSILVQRTRDSTIKQYCLSLLEKVGSLEYTRQTLHNLDADLRKQIHELGGNPTFLAYLDELNNWK